MPTKGYWKMLKRTAKPTTKRQKGFAKGLAKTVKTFVNTKPPKKRKR